MKIWWIFTKTMDLTLRFVILTWGEKVGCNMAPFGFNTTFYIFHCACMLEFMVRGGGGRKFLKSLISSINDVFNSLKQLKCSNLFEWSRRCHSWVEHQQHLFGSSECQQIMYKRKGVVMKRCINWVERATHLCPPFLTIWKNIKGFKRLFCLFLGWSINCVFPKVYKIRDEMLNHGFQKLWVSFPIFLQT